jgi:hypothetical protein
MSLGQEINDVLTLQDVELANSMTQLKKNPAGLSTFIQQRKSDLYNAVTKEHSDNYQKVYGDMTRSSNTIRNISYYHVRNKDLDNTQEAVLVNAKNSADAAVFDSQVAKRQFEINEWTVGNKQDTLFVMQLIFIALTFIVPLLYLSRIELLPMSVFVGIVSLITIALILTFVIRYQYTDKTRDYRFWNRRRFASMGGPPTVPTCEAIQALPSQLASAAQSTAADIGQSAQSGVDRLGRISDAIQNA